MASSIPGSQSMMTRAAILVSAFLRVGNASRLRRFSGIDKVGQHQQGQAGVTVVLGGSESGSLRGYAAGGTNPTKRAVTIGPELPHAQAIRLRT